MKKIRLVFQGDSITDAGRDKRNYHDMGKGYPFYASNLLAEAHPDVEFDFYNFGISGNRTDQLFDRLYPDAIAFQPDIISVLIGINDIWHRHSHNIRTTDDQIEANYRAILERLKRETNAKIVMLAPFVLDADEKAHIFEDLKNVLPIIEKLAEKYADVYIPLYKHFDEALKSQPEPKYYSADGVHPNDNGRIFIGEIYAEAVSPLINSL